MEKLGFERLSLFGMEVCCLISMGKKETLEAIGAHISQGDLVEYIYNRYKENLFVSFDSNSPYDVKLWDGAFSDYDGYIQGNERRKYGIVNEDDGLLLVASLTMEIMGRRIPGDNR